MPVYLLLINALSLVLMRLDKQFARDHRWRIPERTLLAVAALGGSLGALVGMYAFHHKTKHPKFYLTIPVMLGLHILLLAWVSSR